MLFKNDFQIYNQADADRENGLRGWVRTARRALKRCWLDRETINQPRIFCQNIGGCGSTYVVQLLKDNAVERVFHEKAPDLEEMGVQHFENPISSERLVKILRYTRHHVFFEANNRFFTMTCELATAFPNAKFIHLFRDPAQAVASAMSKPNVEAYLKSNVRLRTSIGGPVGAPPFEKYCHHWRIANQRIQDDLETVRSKVGKKYLTLNFEDLVKGNLTEFESFTGLKLTKKIRPPVNARANRPEGRFPDYEGWTSEQKETLEEICGPLFRRLKSQAGETGLFQ
ncbi:MAG: sulfotransferase [Mariniblastus sp.]